MLQAIAIVPSAPVMVPELAGGAAAEVADLRAAVLTAAAALPNRWVAVGVAAADSVIEPGRVGTFAGYGVDLRVGLSPADGGGPVKMPLCALITGWVRGLVRPGVRVHPPVAIEPGMRRPHSVQPCREILGRALCRCA